MKKIIYTVSSALVLSSALFAGGNLKEVAPVATTPMPIEHIEAPTAPMVTEGSTSQLYFGAAIGAGRLKTDRFGTDTATDAMIRIGYDFYRYLGIEARFAKGLSDGSKLTHDYSWGIYLKPYYQVDDSLRLYTLLGYGKSKLTYKKEPTDIGITNNRTEQSGVGYGIGIDYKIDKHWSLFVDAMRYINKSTLKTEGRYAIRVDGIYFGIAYHF